MQFSDTTSNQGLIQDVTFLTGATTTEYTTADRTRNINIWYRKTLTMILGSQDAWDFDDSNYTDFPILTTDLVALQQDYALPLSAENMLKIKRLEINLTGNTKDWKRGSSFDINETGLATDTSSVAADFNTNNPFYDLQYGSIFLYPIPGVNVTGGLKIWISRDISEFTADDTTKKPGFDAPFHRILSLGASYDWAVKHNKPNQNQILNQINDYEARLRRFYGSKDKDRDIVAKSAFINYE